MATWTVIADSTLEPGKPIRSVDGLALRDNPIAITEGATGAPKIQTAAITDANVTAAKLATGNNERDWVLARTASAAVGVVGTYALAKRTTATGNNAGDTVAGSNLQYADVDNNVPVGALSGTWRCMGYSLGGEATLWLRIS
jgi:hypothetical protein